MTNAARPITRGAPAPLHAPWRMAYLDELSGDDSMPPVPSQPDPSASRGAPPSTAPCFLREYFLHPERDERHHVVARDGSGETAGMILLNAFPYANGHLLVALGESRQRLLDYSPAQRAALWRLTDLAVELCEFALSPQGVNVGVNQGEAAGAGVPEHLHVHVVPRWRGDTNFATTVSAVRVIPAALDAMAARYRDAFRRLTQSSTTGDDA